MEAGHEGFKVVIMVPDVDIRTPTKHTTYPDRHDTLTEKNFYHDTFIIFDLLW